MARSSAAKRRLSPVSVAEDGGRSTADRGESVDLGELESGLELDDVGPRGRSHDEDLVSSPFVEERYPLEETAEALEISHATVERDLRSAKAWVISQLGAAGGAG